MSIKPLFATASESFEQGRYTDALSTLNRLLDHTQNAETYELLAKTFIELGFKDDAARTYELAAEAGGPSSEDLYMEAMKLHIELGNNDKALSLGLPLLARAQTDADLAFMISDLLWKRGEKEMLRAFLPVLASSENTKHNSLAFMLLTGSPNDRADRATLQSLVLKMPRSLPILMAHLVSQREVNAYEEIERLQPQLNRIVARDLVKMQQTDGPFYNLMWMENEAINKQIAYSKEFVPDTRTKARRAAAHQYGPKIRIGYLSSDFWPIHATMKLFSAVLEAHDEDRFDITLFCHTNLKYLKDAGDRSRWGRIVSIHDMSDQEAAQTIRDQGIDIIVDMKGHTKDGRPAILNHSAAPVQVAWLGFPGTTVNIDLDYIIGDRFVLPDNSKPHYWEKFCRLPETYQPNNPYQPLARTDMYSRADARLPDDAFVFASFNATRKISVEAIDLWIRILKATPDSLLWIMVTSPEAEQNIRKKVVSSGIAEERLLFTKMMPYEGHLARITLADVGLDSFPYNGHTTTAEQIWAGLPVLTKKGKHFASRVTESLLQAIGLPEMVARDKEHYFRLAVALYKNRQTVAEYKERLQQNRFEKPLFDAERFCRHLETAYEMMIDRAKAGKEPDHIDVPALPAREGRFV